jgi:hypothetical protein
MSSTQVSFQVRPASLRDAKAIAQLHTTSALEAYRGVLPDDQLKTLSMSVDKRLLARGHRVLRAPSPGRHRGRKNHRFCGLRPLTR